MPPRIYQLAQGQVDAMLAEAERMGQARGWRKGFAAALVTGALGYAIAVSVHWLW